MVCGWRTPNTVGWRRKRANVIGIDLLRGKLGDYLREAGLVRRKQFYVIGQREARTSYVESSVSWLARCLGRDRYVYLVSPLESDTNTGYVIERVEQLSFVDPREVVISDMYSGISDEKRGIQRDALWEFNDGTFGERSALTIYGFWIDSGPGDYWPEGEESIQHLGTPFGQWPAPESVRVFATEQAAYSYLEKITGERIPPQVRHLAWIAIAASTILWQWHEEISALFAASF